MKVTHNQFSYPGQSDGYICYEDIISTLEKGYYGNGLWYEYEIHTEIKNNLNALFYCSAPLAKQETSVNNFPTGSMRSFVVPYKVAADLKNNAVITVRIPTGCVCSYKISGDKQLRRTMAKAFELVELANSRNSGFSNLDHSHDGLDSQKILAGNLLPNPGNANKFLKVSADGLSFVYATTDGLPAFSLLTPTDGAQLDILQPSTDFTWNASAGATSYQLIIVNEFEGLEIYNNTAATTTRTVLHTVGDIESGQLYSWFVIASDGTDTISSPTWSFTTTNPTDS